MFKKILLPLDLTDKHRAAIRYAIDLAKRHAGEVELLHVVESIAGLAQDEEKDFYDKLVRVANRFLERIQRDFALAGVACRTSVVVGHRIRESAAFAARIHADLIIVSSPKFEPEHPAASLGSLSYRIGILSPCPVLIVK